MRSSLERSRVVQRIWQKNVYLPSVLFNRMTGKLVQGQSRSLRVQWRSTPKFGRLFTKKRGWRWVFLGWMVGGGCLSCRKRADFNIDFFFQEKKRKREKRKTDCDFVDSSTAISHRRGVRCATSPRFGAVETAMRRSTTTMRLAVVSALLMLLAPCGLSAQQLRQRPPRPSAWLPVVALPYVAALPLSGSESPADAFAFAAPPNRQARPLLVSRQPKLVADPIAVDVWKPERGHLLCCSFLRDRNSTVGHG